MYVGAVLKMLEMAIAYTSFTSEHPIIYEDGVLSFGCRLEINVKGLSKGKFLRLRVHLEELENPNKIY